MRALVPFLAVAALLVGCRPASVTPADDNRTAGGSADAGVASSDGSASFLGPDADFQVMWTDGSVSTQSVDARVCGLETFTLERRPVELMLILDRSGSMNDPAAPGSPTTKWADVTSALDETIMKTDRLVQWGLKEFPSDNVACNVADGAEVPSAPSNYTPLHDQI